MLTGNICLRDVLSHIDAWLQGESGRVPELSFHRYPLSMLDEEYDLYFPVLDSIPRIEEAEFRRLLLGGGDLGHLVGEGGHGDRDWRKRIIVDYYNEKIDNLRKETHDLRISLYRLNKTGAGTDEIDRLKQQQDDKDAEIRLCTQQQQAVLNDIGHPRKLTVSEIAAIQKALEILEINTSRQNPKMSHYAIGSSNELLWILHLFKSICHNGLYTRESKHINIQTFEQLQTMRTDNLFPPYTDVFAFYIEFARIHATVDNVMILLKIRADNIACLDRSMRHTVNAGYEKLSRTVTDLTEEVAKLRLENTALRSVNSDTGDGQKRPRPP